MSKDDDIFGEFYNPSDDHEEYRRQHANEKRRRQIKKAADKLNEVGAAPELTPEMLAKRDMYRNDFIALHKDLFPDSTGVKPFGLQQQKSIQFGQDIFNRGSGRLLKLEPRGYAKTTRITNEALASVLLGMQDYVVIICSNQEKAEEILESIKTEIYNNEQLANLFPGPIACFRHIDNTPQKARYQTYNGVRTYIEWGAKVIQFPYVPDEPSSGKFIEVRPMTNVKGLHKKIEVGPDAGKVFRPTLFLFDDPQTHDDATSETNIKKIIAKIKRDALRGGSHNRRAAAIMSITPVAPGDVAWHFENVEHSWEIIKYKMIEKFPDNHDWWMNEYSKVYLNYDRSLRGDRTRAALDAKKLLEDNWEYAHEGSEVTWEHAYGWDEDPQTEISPVQHAYNIILDDGIEDFEYECQCNTEYGTYQEGERIHAPTSQIISKVLPYRRTQVPQNTLKLVTHIDINMDILTYVVMASPNVLQPLIVDYGTFPKQPGLFSKRNLSLPLKTIYPDCNDYRDILYRASKDLIAELANREYIREDGIRVHINKIGIDIKYEETYITRAIVESEYRSLILPCSGVGLGPDDELLHEKNRPDAIVTYENCYIEPNKSRTLDVLHFDSNYFKTELHRGFNLEAGMKGSICLFGKEYNGETVSEGRHLAFGDHCNAERPIRKIGKKKGKTRIVWEEKMHQADNEFGDNAHNCLAILITEGIKIDIDPTPSQKKKEKEDDMAAFMNQQKNRRLL